MATRFVGAPKGGDAAAMRAARASVAELVAENSEKGGALAAALDERRGVKAP